MQLAVSDTSAIPVPVAPSVVMCVPFEQRVTKERQRNVCGGSGDGSVAIACLHLMNIIILTILQLIYLLLSNNCVHKGCRPP